MSGGWVPQTIRPGRPLISTITGRVCYVLAGHRQFLGRGRWQHLTDSSPLPCAPPTRDPSFECHLTWCHFLGLLSKREVNQKREVQQVTAVGPAFTAIDARKVVSACVCDCCPTWNQKWYSQRHRPSTRKEPDDERRCAFRLRGHRKTSWYEEWEEREGRPRRPVHADGKRKEKTKGNVVAHWPLSSFTDFTVTQRPKNPTGLTGAGRFANRTRALTPMTHLPLQLQSERPENNFSASSKYHLMGHCTLKAQHVHSTKAPRSSNQSTGANSLPEPTASPSFCARKNSSDWCQSP